MLGPKLQSNHCVYKWCCLCQMEFEPLMSSCSPQIETCWMIEKDNDFPSGRSLRSSPAPQSKLLAPGSGGLVLLVLPWLFCVPPCLSVKWPVCHRVGPGHQSPWVPCQSPVFPFTGESPAQQLQLLAGQMLHRHLTVFPIDCSCSRQCI